MKWILWIALVLTPQLLWAAEQYSSAECQLLKQQKETIRKRQNAGYSFAEGERLDQRSSALFQTIARHCGGADDASVEKTADDIAQDQSQTRRQQAPPSKYQGLSLQQMPEFSGRNAIFKGEKLAAWTEFYQVPRPCRQKQLSETEFVACADHKAQQKRAFEAKWQQLTFVPLTAGTAQSRSVPLQSNPQNFERMPVHATETQHSPATRDTLLTASNRYVENIQQQFHWLGLVILLALVIGCWVIWR